MKSVVQGLLILIVLSAAWYWKGRQSEPKIELTELRCARMAMRDGLGNQVFTGRIVVSGSVKNISDQPLALSATAVVCRLSNEFCLGLKGTKTALAPSPVPPGDVGGFSFSTDDRSLADHCKVEFTDDSTGGSVAYKDLLPR